MRSLSWWFSRCSAGRGCPAYMYSSTASSFCSEKSEAWPQDAKTAFPTRKATTLSFSGAGVAVLRCRTGVSDKPKPAIEPEHHSVARVRRSYCRMLFGHLQSKLL